MECLSEKISTYMFTCPDRLAAELFKAKLNLCWMHIKLTKDNKIKIYGAKTDNLV